MFLLALAPTVAALCAAYLEGLLDAHDSIGKHYQLDRPQKKKLRNGALFGIQLVDSVTRLCAMNLLLHGIGGESDSELPVVTKAALAGKHREFDRVLANAPFGKKSSVTIVNEAGEQQKKGLEDSANLPAPHVIAEDLKK